MLCSFTPLFQFIFPVDDNQPSLNGLELDETNWFSIFCKLVPFVFYDAFSIDIRMEPVGVAGSICWASD